MKISRSIAGNKALLALGAGVVATGAVAASAASLGSITPAGLGTSTASVSGCQSGSLTVAWNVAPTYSATGGAGSTPTYTTTGLQLGGIAAACQGKTYKVTVGGASGASLGEGSGTTTAASATTNVTGITAFDSAQAVSVTVTIYNT